MNLTELAAKYRPHLQRRGSLTLIPAEHAIELLKDAEQCPVRFLGIEAFRLYDDGSVQPAIQFSNISYGKIEGNGEFTPDFDLRDGWRSDPTALHRSRVLIVEGTQEGYSHYEVHFEGLDGTPLFDL